MKAIHHHVAKVLIDDEIIANHFLPAEPNILEPCRQVRIITINGEIWTKCFRAFNLTSEGIVADWDRLMHQTETDWRKIEHGK